MIQKAKEGLESCLRHLETEYSKLQLGRANPSMLDDVMIDQFGSLSPLKNVASISNMDSQTLSIKPWDKTIIHSIAKAITESGLGLNPQTMADSIMIKVPALTEERRKEVSKIAKKQGEEAKISVRNVRSDILKSIKKQEDEKEISEDIAKGLESDLQKLVEEYNKKIDIHYKEKEADIMKI